VVLDVRNGYEWDAGHFQGAGRPAEEVFNETPVSVYTEALSALPTSVLRGKWRW
jgi:predicted sulfurtransferase